MRRRLWIVPLASALVGLPAAAGAQLPLGYVPAEGGTVTPAYEGWYPNGDGTITLSFGFYNRNSGETLEVPHGPMNRVEPTNLDGPQPTHFTPGRQWGAFGIVVPEGYSGDPVRWTLTTRGKTYSIPANLTADFMIDALVGDAQGNFPPELAFAENGPWFAGPGGAYLEATAKAGVPVGLSVWARDDGVGGGSVSRPEQEAVPVTLTWFKHSGPGEVVFDSASAKIPVEGGVMATHATFAAPGDYILRVRANDASGVSGAGHSQCCWSNAFLKVTVANR